MIVVWVCRRGRRGCVRFRLSSPPANSPCLCDSFALNLGGATIGNRPRLCTKPSKPLNPLNLLNPPIKQSDNESPSATTGRGHPVAAAQERGPPAFKPPNPPLNRPSPSEFATLRVGLLLLGVNEGAPATVQECVLKLQQALPQGGCDGFGAV